MAMSPLSVVSSTWCGLHVAYVKHIFEPHYSGSGVNYHHEILVACCTHYRNGEREPSFDFYTCQCGAYPAWFLGATMTFSKVDRSYQAILDAFRNGVRDAQIIYSFERAGHAEVFVHTPSVDDPGYFATYESEAYDPVSGLLGMKGEVFYVEHRLFSGCDRVTIALSKLRRFIRTEIGVDT